MGMAYKALCRRCGAKFNVREGGGFVFHLLHCDQCGREKSVYVNELGEIHNRYIKGLSIPFSSHTASYDRHIQETYEGESITKEQYNYEVESVAGKCECGGNFRLDAKARCPQCKSADFEDTGEVELNYD